MKRQDLLSDSSYSANLKEMESMIPDDAGRHVTKYILSLKNYLRFAGSSKALLIELKRNLILNLNLDQLKNRIRMALKQEADYYKAGQVLVRKVNSKLKAKRVVKSIENIKGTIRSNKKNKKNKLKGKSKRKFAPWINIISVPMGGMNK